MGQLIQDGCAGGDQHDAPQLCGIERTGDVARPLFAGDPCGHLGDVFAHKTLHSGSGFGIPIGDVEHRQPGEAVFAALRQQRAHDVHHVLGATPGGFAPPPVGSGAGRGHRGGGQPESELGLARKVLVERRSRYTGCVDDVVHRDIGQALAGSQQGGRGIEDLLFAGGAPLPRSSRSSGRRHG
uniref:Uncharacterized protein n=1 Tax=Mycolicibacterium neoaurum VKM Ac-1815D TaxID=700508 RepID=V5XJM9_MYCNE